MDIKIEITPNGRLRIKRGGKEHNQHLLEILSKVIDDKATMEEIEEFAKKTEEVEVLVGDTIYCG